MEPVLFQDLQKAISVHCNLDLQAIKEDCQLNKIEQALHVNFWSLNYIVKSVQ